MSTAQRKFRPDIEGLRAVAVGLVVLSHAGVGPVEGGYIGVDVFFVLSGFLITGLLVREQATTGAISMAGFYARRARRILPAASLVLILTVLASYEWLGFIRGNAIAEDGKWTALFAANLRFASEGTQYLNLTAPPSPLQHYWSLAVEEQFYVVWPALFLIVAAIAPRVSVTAKLAATLAMIIAASLAWSVVQTDSNPAWAFFSPLTRAWELAVGALLAIGEPRLRQLPRALGPWLSWSGFAAVIGAAFWLDNSTAFPGYAVILPVMGTALVVAAGSIAPAGGAERLLAMRPFQMLGKWSYSLYLWHWPVLIIAAQHAGHSLSLAQNLGLVAAALGLAIVTHSLGENPIRCARPLVRSSRVSLTAGVCMVVAAYGLSGLQISANSSPGTAAQSASPADGPIDIPALVAASAAITTLPRDITPSLETANGDFGWLLETTEECLLDANVVESPPCVFGDPEGSRTVILLGDSHAAQWLVAFDEVGSRLGWRVEVLAKAGCPAASLDFRRAYQSFTQRVIGPAPQCIPWLENSIARINATAPDVLVLASCNGCEYMVDANGDVLSRETWAAGLEETLHRITVPDATRVVMGDIPRLKGSVDCLALHAGNVQNCSRPVEEASAATYNDVERGVAEANGIAFVDVTEWFCREACSPVIGNVVVYTNDYHVTATYVRRLFDEFQAVFQPIVEGQ